MKKVGRLGETAECDLLFVQQVAVKAVKALFVRRTTFLKLILKGCIVIMFYIFVYFMDLCVFTILLYIKMLFE